MLRMRREYNLSFLHAQRVQPKFFCMLREYNLNVAHAQRVQPDRGAAGTGGVQLHHPGPPLPRHLLQEAPHPTCRPPSGKIKE